MYITYSLMKKTLLFLLLCISVAFSRSYAQESEQQYKIEGVVLDANNHEPLIGASIYIPHSDLQQLNINHSIGTNSDVDGKFSLIIPSTTKRVIISYIGYKEETIQITPTQKRYTVLLQTSSQALDDFVVTGYQELERRKLTAAISKINVSDAMIGASTSIDQALAGQIAGVSVSNISGAPGSPTRIRIRGTASINGTQDPLWVLDGIPLEGTDIPTIDANNDNDITNIAQTAIAGISPSDIENITILKDAAATAIYGARAANGVIIITTKRGRSGKPQVSISSKTTFSPTIGTSRLELLNAQEKVDLELELLQEPPFEMFWGIVQLPVFLEKGQVATILKANGLIDTYKASGWNGLPANIQEQITQLKGINTDWQKILFRNALTQEHNISISGGNNNATYYHSLGFTREEGNIKNVDMTRINLTSKIDYLLSSALKVGVSVFANRRKNRTFLSDTYGLTNPIYYSRIANPYFQPILANGAFAYDYDVIANNESDTSQGFNILEEQQNTYKKGTTTALNAILNAQLTLGKYWKANTQVGIQWDNLSQEEFADEETFYMRNLRQNSAYYSNGNRVFLIPTGGMLRNIQNTTSQVTWKTIAEYNSMVYDSNHEIQVMFGSEIRKNWNQSTSSTGYGFDPQTYTFKNLIFRDENQANNRVLKTKSSTQNAFASFFANGSYSIDQKYTLGASIRIDGSDLFGVDPKYRYLPIYSISGLWRISNEPFIAKHIPRIANLALRSSFGLQGNIDKNTSPYLIGTYSNVNLVPQNSETNILISSAPNRKLRWEKTTSYNIGIDLSNVQGNINASIDYYHRKGTDLIGNKTLPLENGFTNMSVNWASMRNNGLEVNLQTRNITSKNFSWYTTLNFAYNSNKILKVITNTSQTQPSLEGHPIGAIFALKTKGIDPNTGQILIEGTDGQAYNVETLFNMTPTYDGTGGYTIGLDTESERKLYHYMGTSEAPYTGGLLNQWSYKNWELNLNLSYNIGAHVRSAPTYDIIDFDPGRNTNRDILNRWRNSSSSFSMPALATQNHNPADYALFSSRKDLYRSLDIWVKKVNFVRIQNIRLAYRLPLKQAQMLRLKGATIALEVRNPFIISSNYRYYTDPESMSNLYATPIPRTYTMSINIQL